MDRGGPPPSPSLPEEERDSSAEEFCVRPALPLSRCEPSGPKPATTSRRSHELIGALPGRPYSIGARAFWPASSTPRARTGARADREHRRRDHRLDHLLLPTLGFDFVVETAPLERAQYVRLRRRPPATVALLPSPPIRPSPASARSTAWRSRAGQLKVASYRASRERCRLYDITTGTGDFIANGVVSHNCFARPTHTYLDFNAGRDFEREIVVKVNTPEVARAELMRPSWKREHVALGTNTDPISGSRRSTSCCRACGRRCATRARPAPC